MKVYKFGGASVKDAAGIKNVFNILQKIEHSNILIVVSAMGKTTNALEAVIKNYFDKSKDLLSSINQIKKYHHEIILELFENKNHAIFKTIHLLFTELEHFLHTNKSPNYNYVYDQVICFGEIISTTIISHYFHYKGINNKLLDVRNFIKTDTNYRDATVNWEQTEQNISQKIYRNILNITQGFLGSDSNNFTTTLGREGSDYTAAIFAYCLNAESVTIWKDVPGVLNADPKHFKDTILLDQISYREAIELAFYGATVIHPKTLQPLQGKEIPLYVKSFINPALSGTCVKKGVDLDPYHPCFIIKKDQILISLSSINFDFIMEENISEIFALLHRFQMKVHLIQNSAISFSVCVFDKFENLDAFHKIMSQKFQVNYENNVTLYTIRHFTPQSIQNIEKNKNVLLKQVSRETIQIVTK